MKSNFLCVLLIPVLLTLSPVHSFYLPGTASVTYQTGDQIPVYVNRLDSVSEALAFDYYFFDFCQPPADTKKFKYPENLGQILFGERITLSPMLLTFLKPSKCIAVCTKEYNPAVPESLKKIQRFQKKISQGYNHHWIVDNLPVVLPVKSNLEGDDDLNYDLQFPMGRLTKEKTFIIFNHFDFLVKYHPSQDNQSGRIITVEVEYKSIKHPPTDACLLSTAEGPQQLYSDQPFTISYTYSVRFEKSDHMWATRWDAYLKVRAPSVHWFSIINSLLITLFLSGMVAMILLRALHKDIARYNKTEVSEEEAMEEFGWKLVHGDVFRPPSHSMLLSVALGTGVQFLLMGAVSIFFACLGILSPANRGSFVTAAIVLFMCLGTPNGYISARIYKMTGGEMWKTNVLLTSFLFPGILFGGVFLLNTILWSQQSSGAIPFSTMIAVVALWFCISVPLCFVGAYIGFKKPAVEHPVRTNQIPRQIPNQVFYMKPIPSALIGGILPFGAIFIELLFILASIWTHQVYYLFGFLFIVSGILFVTCAEVSILLCYFHLCSEDYSWWWQSFFSSASTALYLLFYSLFYYHGNLPMHGFINAVLYFGYTLMFCSIFALITGTVGFFACFLFVRTIYSYVKVD